MFLVGIAGGSGSGKTTFAQKAMRQLGGPEVSILHQDHYYLPSPPAHLITDNGVNYDHPDAFDWDLLLRDLKRLKDGGKVDVPVYDFKSSRRISKTEAIGPCRAVLVEGIYALW